MVLLSGSILVAVAVQQGATTIGPLPREHDPLLRTASDLSRNETATARLARAFELEHSGDLRGAAREAAAAHQLGGGRDAALQAAKIAILEERWDDAEAWLRPLVAENPDDGAAHYDLGLVAHHRGRIDAARASYRAALDLDPRNAAARYNLALLESNAGSHEQARAHATAFLRDFPDDPRGPGLLEIVERGR
jgi:tetratricopeptide (TPR) repeat protein